MAIMALPRLLICTILYCWTTSFVQCPLWLHGPKGRVSICRSTGSNSNTSAGWKMLILVGGVLLLQLKIKWFLPTILDGSNAPFLGLKFCSELQCSDVVNPAASSEHDEQRYSPLLLCLNTGSSANAPFGIGSCLF